LQGALIMSRSRESPSCHRRLPLCVCLWAVAVHANGQALRGQGQATVNETQLESSVSGILGHPAPGSQYPEHENFTLMLVEEFDEPIDLDNDPIWTWSDGGLMEGQVRFSKEAISFEGGVMKITVSGQQYPTQSCSHAEAKEMPYRWLSSGDFRTKHNMFRYGRYEARIKAPSVQEGNTDINGNYISTMFVYRDAKYHHWREIDVEITGDSPHSLMTNALSADNTEMWSGLIADSKQFNLSQNTRSSFVTYAIEWLPDRITWFVDGQKIREKHGPGGRVPISDKSAKIMMNLWIFGSNGFGGSQLWNNRYPMHSEYDWFRFYKWNHDEEYPCAGMSQECLSEDDMYLSGNNPCDGIHQQGLLHGKQVCEATCNAR
jgi:hypothetical protein